MKLDVIADFLKKQDNDNIIPLHNDCCYYFDTIYSMSCIDLYYSQSELDDIINNIGNFDKNSKYFLVKDGDTIVTDNVTDVIDYNRLAEHLIDWGDSDYNFDISDYLVNKFKDIAYSELSHITNKETISTLIDDSDFDFLMDDWYDMVKKIEKKL